VQLVLEFCSELLLVLTHANGEVWRMSNRRTQLLFLCLTLQLVTACFRTSGQALVESGGMSSQSAIPQQKQTTVATPPIEKQSISPHLTAPTGSPTEDVNRQQFEDRAGNDAGKLLLRSTPSGAEIFINDLPVGQTPLLMIVAPGKYKIDMRGQRQEYGHSTVGIMRKETQTVVLRLNQRYPTSIAIHKTGL
jgi:hypothetical protein